MGHPDGAHTHGSGGLGTAVLSPGRSSPPWLSYSMFS